MEHPRPPSALTVRMQRAVIVGLSTAIIIFVGLLYIQDVQHGHRIERLRSYHKYMDSLRSAPICIPGLKIHKFSEGKA